MRGHGITFHETTREATVAGDSAASRTREPKFVEATRYQRVISQDYIRAAMVAAVVVTVCLKHHEANNAITVLHLDLNNIGDEGAVALANGLKARHVMCAFKYGPFIASDTLIVVPGRLRQEDAFMCASDVSHSYAQLSQGLDWRNGLNNVTTSCTL